MAILLLVFDPKYLADAGTVQGWPLQKNKWNYLFKFAGVSIEMSRAYATRKGGLSPGSQLPVICSSLVCHGFGIAKTTVRTVDGEGWSPHLPIFRLTDLY
jgi:hypothetical protein